MKLGNISTDALLGLLKFAMVFNPEYIKVMEFVKEDPLENFEEVKNRGWRITTESYYIQFETKDFSEIDLTLIFDQKTEQVVARIKDFSKEVAVVSELTGLSFDEASKIVENIFK